MIGKKFSRPVVVAVATLVCCVTSPALGQVTFEWVTVGNPGNASDFTGRGSVANEYRIAKYEVTNDQYAELLNAVAATDTNGLYNASMDSDTRGGITQSGSSGSFTYVVKADMGNKPVVYVSFLDAMRFVNWLHNGQPNGAQDTNTTEDGVYTVSAGLTETRALDAKFFIPSENEWYKAAYHQLSADGGDGDDYWLYPTASNSAPTVATANANGGISNPGVNVANYLRGAIWNSQTGNVTTVGSAGSLSESFYGTSDQGGNVWEWNEKLVSASIRGLRGGGFLATLGNLGSTILADDDPTIEISRFGFRVASPVVCGDGMIDGAEECDDGNTEDDDGCSACVVDQEALCSGEPSVCITGIPTVSEWGLVAMVLLMLTAGTIVLRKRLPHPA